MRGLFIGTMRPYFANGYGFQNTVSLFIGTMRPYSEILKNRFYYRATAVATSCCHWSNFEIQSSICDYEKKLLIFFPKFVSLITCAYGLNVPIKSINVCFNGNPRMHVKLMSAHCFYLMLHETIGRVFWNFLLRELCGNEKLSEIYRSSPESSGIISAGIYLLKVNNGSTRKMCKFCSKLRKKAPEKRRWRLLQQ